MSYSASAGNLQSRAGSGMLAPSERMNSTAALLPVPMVTCEGVPAVPAGSGHPASLSASHSTQQGSRRTESPADSTSGSYQGDAGIHISTIMPDSAPATPARTPPAAVSASVVSAASCRAGTASSSAHGRDSISSLPRLLLHRNSVEPSASAVSPFSLCQPRTHQASDTSASTDQQAVLTSLQQGSSNSAQRPHLCQMLQQSVSWGGQQADDIEISAADVFLSSDSCCTDGDSESCVVEFNPLEESTSRASSADEGSTSPRGVDSDDIAAADSMSAPLQCHAPSDGRAGRTGGLMVRFQETLQTV